MRRTGDSGGSAGKPQTLICSRQIRLRPHRQQFPKDPETRQYTRLTQAFDERDNLTEQAFFDEAGKPTRSKDGYAKVTMAYDARGNEIAAAYFDEAGRPTRLKEGYATFTKAYDARGNRIGQAYYDEEGKPIRSKDGYASMTWTYDARGNEVEARSTMRRDARPWTLMGLPAGQRSMTCAAMSSRQTCLTRLEDRRG